jgi:thiamine-monophosphate kinase
MKLSEIGEFGFIDRIAPLGDIRSEGIIKGIGDDCAVIDMGGPDYLLITTDLLVEKVHFLFQWGSPEIIGAKSLAINISDIAACGGKPLDAFISLAVPDRIEVEWLERFYRGMSEIAREYSVNLLGGDTTGSKSDLLINIALTGSVPRKEVLFRHTAQPGDLIILTGPPGDSAAGLEILLESSDAHVDLEQDLVRAHLEPRPHVKEGRLLAESGACTAAIDVSDGVSSDLGHLCRESGAAALIYEDKLPMTQNLLTIATRMSKDPLDFTLHGGEAYVLLAAIEPSRLDYVEDLFKQSRCEFYPIGKLVPGEGIQLVRSDDSVEMLVPGGWDHFK